MSTFVLNVTILLVLAYIGTSNCLRSFIMDFETLNYEFNPKIMKNVNFKLIDYNKRKAINGSFTLTEELHELQIVHWVAGTKSNGQFWNVYNITLDACKILENTYGKINPLASIFINELKKHMKDLPKKCPFKKDKPYSVINFHLNEELFPPYLPEIVFGATLGFVRYNELFANFTITAYVESKNGQKFRQRNGKN
ncbi:uncharacterized protein LOC131995690 [Stomoxys calcitrans]|uniref:uncharacterized protein LOC131995690 n=1 Tax=Stomoxys calcitrans TaxID=35570 RepID=UPI0027E34C99|nr:uncharacterized protein LOC131995690 [Stomoxys calcitrans]